MSLAVAGPTSKDLGQAIEVELADRLPLELVDDGEARWYDATAEHTISIALVDLSDTICVSRGTPVEIKAAKVRTSNGADGSRRGRIYLKRNSHLRLLESGGVYCVAVHDREELLATAWIRPETIDELADSWYDVDRPHGQVCKIAWSRLIPPEIVTGGGRP